MKENEQDVKTTTTNFYYDHCHYRVKSILQNIFSLYIRFDYTYKKRRDRRGGDDSVDQILSDGVRVSKIRFQLGLML